MSRYAVDRALDITAIVAVALMISGILIVLVRADPVTGLIFPFGVALWWGVGAIARRRFTPSE
jgi:hypothetical protein